MLSFTQLYCFLAPNPLIFQLIAYKYIHPRMGFTLIGAPLLEKSRQATVTAIKECVVKKGVAQGSELLIDRDKFKMGNLDTLMYINDKLIKVQSTLQAFLKRIDRQYMEVNDNQSAVWEVKSIDGNQPLDKFIYRFKWNDSKFPRSMALNKILESIEGKINHFENQLKHKVNAYNETKTALSQNQQKEGNYYVKDLNDLLVEPVVKPKDFINTKYVSTIVVIMNSSQEKDFLENYQTLTDNVIPKSAGKLGVPEKDGLVIWKVHIFNVKKKEEEREEKQEGKEGKEGKDDKHKRIKRDLTVAQQFIEAARQKIKVTAKEFKFESGLSEKRQGLRAQLSARLKQNQKVLQDLCEACFSDAFDIYMHAKVLRLVIEANMRFGKQGVIFYIIEYVNGKEKMIQMELVDLFGGDSQQGLYGTKDQIDDAEDFFPYVHVPIVTI